MSASRDETVGAPARVFTRCYPGRPDQVRRARAFLGAVLDGCPGAGDAILCLSEIVSNAIQHSASGAPGGQFTVHVEVDEQGRVRVAVADGGGTWREPPRDGEHGRGLAIVRALASDLNIAGDETGRVVSFRCEPGGFAVL
jgi:hypothetical protein